MDLIVLFVLGMALLRLWCWYEFDRRPA